MIGELNAQFGILRPEFGPYLLMLLPLIILLALSDRARNYALFAFGVQGQQRSAFARFLPLLVVLFMLLALIGPYWGVQETKISSSGQDIFLLIDVSDSMLAEDPSPSRLELARRKAEDLLAVLGNENRADRVAIVLFAGASYLFCPLTLDRGVLRTYIRSISSHLISAPGSDLASAIKVALQSAADAKSDSPILVMLGDGEDNAFNAEDSLSALKVHRSKFYALGIGSEQGKPIKLEDGTFLKDSQGEIVISKLQKAPLQRLSTESGGFYQDMRLDDSDWLRILSANIAQGNAIGSEDNGQVNRVYGELGPLLLCLLLFFLLFMVFQGKRGLIFGLTFFVLVFQQAAYAEERVSLYEAYRAYQDGDFARAANGFEQYLKHNPGDLRAARALGSAQYKLGQFKKAEETFKNLAPQTDRAISEKTAQADNLYNLGNAKFKAKDLKGAISSYESALALEPEDKEAKHNLEVAKRLLEQQQKQQQQQQEDKEQQQNSEEKESSQQDQQDGSSQNHSSSERSAGQGASDSSAQSSQGHSKGGQDGSSSSQSDEAQNSSGGEESSGSSSSDSGENQQDEAQNSQRSSGQAQKRLSQSEAETWLDSLEDSPVLLQKQTGKSKNYVGQTW